MMSKSSSERPSCNVEKTLTVVIIFHNLLVARCTDGGEEPAQESHERCGWALRVRAWTTGGAGIRKFVENDARSDLIGPTNSTREPEYKEGSLYRGTRSVVTADSVRSVGRFDTRCVASRSIRSPQLAQSRTCVGVRAVLLTLPATRAEKKGVSHLRETGRIIARMAVYNSELVCADK